jgi:hypothetical protein
LTSRNPIISRGENAPFARLRWGEDEWKQREIMGRAQGSHRNALEDCGKGIELWGSNGKQWGGYEVLREAASRRVHLT